MAAPASGSANPGLKHFNFFDAAPVKDAHDLANSPEAFQKTPEISVLASSSYGMLLADIYGNVHLLNRDFESLQSWVAHTAGRVTHMTECKGILVTIGEEEGSSSPLLKIWDLRGNKKSDHPLLLRSVKIQHGSRPYPVSAIALSSSLSHLAIGLADGTVVIYRHLEQSLSSSGALGALPKPRTILDAQPTEPITGLGFHEPSADSDKNTLDGKAKQPWLFVATTGRVLCLPVSGKASGAAGSAAVVDESGAALGCAVMDWRAKNMIVARDEAIYTCTTEGRGASVVYEGLKTSVYTHLNYLVMVSPPFHPTGSSASATVRNFVAKTPTLPERADVAKLTVFDLENKFVAFSDTFVSGVREVVSEWGHIYVLTNEGKLTRLEEKPTPEKLDMLYRRGNYTLALNIAETQALDASSVADIHRQYGDALYAKGDYDAAMQQFVKTIGHLQPSYVIRKFLDAQRIHNLVTYLQDLHSLGLANSEHTTLLLNTYTKLKDVARLDSFIKMEAKPSSDGTPSDEPPFDLETAIRVCRQAGYFEYASYLAKKYKRHEDYLRIQVEDAGNYRDALAYVRRLDPSATEYNLARYGRIMLANLPDETVQLLIDICTGQTHGAVNEEIPTTKRDTSATPSYLSYLALGRSQTASSDVPTPTSPSPATPIATPSKQADATSTQIAPPKVSASLHEQQDVPGTPTVLITKPKLEKLPSPRQYFSHFVDNMEKFVVFLEAVALRRWGQTVDAGSGVSAPRADASPLSSEEDTDKNDQTAVWDILLELYLALSQHEGEATNHDDTVNEDGDESPLRRKALAVLQSTSLPYDPTHALMLCTTRNFTPGLVLLWERLGMYEDIVRYWIARTTDARTEPASASASSHVLAALDKYGEAQPRLYPLVLRFLSSDAVVQKRHVRELGAMLEHIERRGIMHPLGVVQALARNEVTSVGLVKEWLLLRIKEAKEEVETDQQLINSYREETKTKLKQVEELSDPDHPKVFHVTRCATCNTQLELPSVHFMCSHSYHQRCLADNEVECPKCVQAHGMLREIRRNNERLAGQHDLFVSEVKENGFNAVAGAFGRGWMRLPRVDDVASS